MKKISYALTMLGMAAAMMACSHENDSHCDAGFVDGCQNGAYVYCHIERDSKEGKIVSDISVEFNGIDYMCDSSDNLVPKDYSCKGGKLLKDGEVVSDNVVCGKDDKLVSCDGDSVVVAAEICNGDSVMKCRDGKVSGKACATGLECMNYERADLIYAACFKSENVVGAGCDKDATTFGTCDASGGLTFCTRKDQAKGKTIRLDCAGRDQACMFINDDWGYDCSAVCQDTADKVNEHGMCDSEANDLYYCDGEAGVTKKLECGTSEVCGFSMVSGQYDCLGK